MATMNYKMKIALDLVEAQFQRNKSDPDQDIATLWVTTTNNLDSKFVAGPAAIGALGSGQMVTLDPTLVETQEFVVNDEDQIVIMPFINNQSYVPPDQAISQALKIAGGVLMCVASGEALAGFILQAGAPPGSTSEFANFVTKDGLIGALVGGIAAGIGEILGDIGSLLGLDDPDCDGPVFNPKSGTAPMVSEILDHIKGFRADGELTLDVPLPLITWTDDTQISQTGCGHNPSTFIRLIVTISDPTPIPMLVGESIGPPTHFKPILSRPPAMWEGQWIDQRFMQDASIVADIQISASFRGRVAPSMIAIAPVFPQAVAALPTHNALIENLRLNRSLGALVGGSPLIAAAKTSSRMTTGELTAIVTERFTVSKTIAAQSDNLAAALLPMTAWDFDKPTFAFDFSLIPPHPHHIVEPMTEAVPSPAAPLAMPSGRGSTIGVPTVLGAKTQFADTLLIGDGMVLQMFGAYDAKERFVGPRLRYMRVDSDGAIVTDVMLQPPEVPVR